MNVRVWLRGPGLGRYEERFRENKIDSDVLGDLTEVDLRELGVPVGDRRRLLRAIAELSSPQALTTRSRLSPVAPTLTRSLPQLDSAERRPITVMFCDLVGSTQLAAALDVEDWRNLVSAYLDAASNAVTQFGGHVIKRLGDGLMAAFGYPRAQDDDAERAVLAALAVQQALGELNARNAGSAPQLAVRVGLEGGPVVVDDDGDVFGETPNAAAQVQAAAEPGTVLVTSTVQRQVAGLFVVEDKGPYELEGTLAPTNLYRVLRISGGRRRRQAELLTPFVGREKDLDVVARCAERALAGALQFVLIAGEPGIGKSRLIDTRASATNFFALTEWHLGELERARQLTDESTSLATELGHAASLSGAFFFKTMIENRRGDVQATSAAVNSLLAGTQEHNLKTYADLAQVYASWVRGKEGEPGAGAFGLKEALASYLAQGNKSGAPMAYGLLAELEAMRPDMESALAAVDAGLAIAEETGERYTDSYLYRLRGDLLLMRSPEASVPAEEAFQTAIAVANRQGARGYALLASHSLAKLYKAIGRCDHAQAILAPALEGFLPTSEMPEIAEAQTLLSRLSVKPPR